MRTIMSAIVAAVIYMPAACRLTPTLARNWMMYFDRRGYELYGIVRDPALLDQMLASGQAQVAIIARNDPWLGDAEQTVRLPHTERQRDFNSARVRRVIFDGEPAPRGLDPEAIAAARRIARALNERG